MFSIPLSVKIAATRFYYSMGGFGLHRAAIMASQELTKKPSSPVRVYESIAELTDYTRKLTWTEDPWGGKLDAVKHPTFMQESINSHPDFSGDCDDYANYFTCALRKGKLAESPHMGFALWEEKGDLTGHMVCIFLKEGSWWWMSNWHNCTPQRIENMYGWIDAMQSEMNKKVLVAGRIMVDGIQSDDTVLIGSVLRCR